MSQPTGGDHITGTFTGNVTGQVAVGKNISQTHQVGAPAPVTDAEREELRQLFAQLKAEVASQAPPDQKASALERLDELEEAVQAEEPDLNTMEYVKRWFLRKLPTFAGVVTGVLVNPVVGKLVQSAGDSAVAQLDRLAQE